MKTCLAAFSCDGVSPVTCQAVEMPAILVTSVRANPFPYEFGIDLLLFHCPRRLECDRNLLLASKGRRLELLLLEPCQSTAVHSQELPTGETGHGGATKGSAYLIGQWLKTSGEARSLFSRVPQSLGNEDKVQRPRLFDSSSSVIQTPRPRTHGLRCGCSETAWSMSYSRVQTRVSQFGTQSLIRGMRLLNTNDPIFRE